MRVAWTPPERPNGVISEYRVLSYRVNPPQSTPDETVITDINVLNATITALQPYTTYEIRIQASTVGGSAVGPGKNVTTEESGILFCSCFCYYYPLTLHCGRIFVRACSRVTVTLAFENRGGWTRVHIFALQSGGRIHHRN